MVPFAYEKNQKKVGRLCPGSNIEILDEEKIDYSSVQTLIVMPYSFIDEFVKKEVDFLKSGGKLVTLVPDIKEYKF